MKNSELKIQHLELPAPHSPLETRSSKFPAWVLISPYGDFPNVVGLQHFTETEARAVVREFNSVLNTPSRLLGLPWYIGHPDHEPMKSRYTDTKAYGRIKKLDARADGLWGQVKWSDAGKRLIADEAFHGHSVNWAMKKIGNKWHPFRLKSVGFTNEPGIPTPPITAANEQPETAAPPESPDQPQPSQPTEEDIMYRHLMIDLLGLDPSITDDQLNAAIAAFKTANAANETVLAELTTKVQTAEAEAVNERAERARLLIAEGLRVGKLTRAEEAEWLEKFSHDFATAVNELSTAKPKINIESKVLGTGQRRAATLGKVQLIQDAVNERMKTKGGDYHANYLAVKKEKPDLFVDVVA